jgi:hypothetical protein
MMITISSCFPNASLPDWDCLQGSGLARGSSSRSVLGVQRELESVGEETMVTIQLLCLAFCPTWACYPGLLKLQGWASLAPTHT